MMGSAAFGRADRHIAGAVLGATAVVLLAMALLMTLFALLDELQESADGYGFVEALWYCGLTLPRRIYEVLPYAVFLGALIGLGSLANHRELVALRAAGMSPWRIFRGVALGTLLFMGAGLWLGEVTAPSGEARAEVYKQQIEQSSVSLSFTGGYWYREGPLYMNVEGLSPSGELLGVRQYHYDGTNKLQVARYAERAIYDAQARGWRLFEVQETRFGSEKVATHLADEWIWHGQATPRLLSASVLLEPRKLSISDLRYQVAYMEREGLGSGRYQVSFWSKVMQPLAVLGLALLSLAFVLGPLREVSIGVRLSVGVLAGLAFKYLQDLFAPMSLVYDLPSWLAVLIPIVVCWVVSAVAIRAAA
ncbi:MAG: LPS export ABC transporter permease LptG [Pseudomonadales bacterium]